MKPRKLHLLVLSCLFLLIFRFAFADGIDGSGIFNDVENKFLTQPKTWAGALTNSATWLFFTLGAISLVWTGISLVLRKGDIADFFSEFIRFILFFGFFLWLLRNGIQMGTDLINSFTQLGSQASGAGAVSPSGLVQVAFDLWNQSSPSIQSLKWAEKLGAILMLTVTTVFVALIAINFLLLKITAWLYLYAGIFVLGFGGSRWTSDIAIGYFKQLLNISLQLMTMILMIGISKNIITDLVGQIEKMALFDFVVILLVSITLFILSNKVPSMVGSVVGGIGNGGAGTFGGGAALAATGVAAGALTGAASKMKDAGFELAGAAKALNELTNGGGGSSGGKKGSAIEALKDSGSVGNNNTFQDGQPLMAEGNKAQPTEDNKAQPAESNKAQPAEGNKSQPAESNKAQPGTPSTPETNSSSPESSASKEGQPLIAGGNKSAVNQPGTPSTPGTNSKPSMASVAKSMVSEALSERINKTAGGRLATKIQEHRANLSSSMGQSNGPSKVNNDSQQVFTPVNSNVTPPNNDFRHLNNDVAPPNNDFRQPENNTTNEIKAAPQEQETDTPKS